MIEYHIGVDVYLLHHKGSSRGETSVIPDSYTKDIVAFIALWYKIFCHLEGKEEESFLSLEAQKALLPPLFFRDIHLKISKGEDLM